MKGLLTPKAARRRMMKGIKDWTWGLVWGFLIGAGVMYGIMHLAWTMDLIAKGVLD